MTKDMQFMGDFKLKQQQEHMQQVVLHAKTVYAMFGVGRCMSTKARPLANWMHYR